MQNLQWCSLSWSHYEFLKYSVFIHSSQWLFVKDVFIQKIFLFFATSRPARRLSLRHILMHVVMTHYTYLWKDSSDLACVISSIHISVLNLSLCLCVPAGELQLRRGAGKEGGQVLSGRHCGSGSERRESNPHPRSALAAHEEVKPHFTHLSHLFRLVFLFWLLWSVMWTYRAVVLTWYEISRYLNGGLAVKESVVMHWRVYGTRNYLTYSLLRNAPFRNL